MDEELTPTILYEMISEKWFKWLFQFFFNVIVVLSNKFMQTVFDGSFKNADCSKSWIEFVIKITMNKCSPPPHAYTQKQPFQHLKTKKSFVILSGESFLSLE